MEIFFVHNNIGSCEQDEKRLDDHICTIEISFGMFVCQYLCACVSVGVACMSVCVFVGVSCLYVYNILRACVCSHQFWCVCVGACVSEGKGLGQPRFGSILIFQIGKGNNNVN